MKRNHLIQATQAQAARLRSGDESLTAGVRQFAHGLDVSWVGA